MTKIETKQIQKPISIVKPDGSRVLVITTTIGGMESTMSLEISKPTNMLNEEHAKENGQCNQNINELNEVKPNLEELNLIGEMENNIEG